MKLLVSTKKDTDRENSENLPKLESVQVVFSQKWLPTHVKSFVYFCSKHTIWTVNK